MCHLFYRFFGSAWKGFRAVTKTFEVCVASSKCWLCRSILHYRAQYFNGKTVAKKTLLSGVPSKSLQPDKVRNMTVINVLSWFHWQWDHKMRKYGHLDAFKSQTFTDGLKSSYFLCDINQLPCLAWICIFVTLNSFLDTFSQQRKRNISKHP